MSGKFAVVDLFAGPGGLAEGFSSVRSVGNGRAFSIVLSVEKEFSAHQTLLLRSFLRQFCDGFPEEYYCFLNGETAEPDWSALYPDQWRAATREALNLELGPPAVASELNVRLDTIRENYQGNVVLIGGPPCQAYSVVGRARNRGITGYTAREDPRHFLYKEYVRILDRLRPAVFVMENVKGILSSSVDGDKVFDRVLEDLCAIGSADDSYQLVPLSPRSRGTSCLFGSHPLATDFIVRAEDFGLPQARHRVIVVGVRRDIAARQDAGKFEEGLLQVSGRRTVVRDVLEGMPTLRSGLSRLSDDESTWLAEVSKATRLVTRLTPALPRKQVEAFHACAREVARRLNDANACLSRSGVRPTGIGANCPDDLRDWLLDPILEVLPNNETRSHMSSDLVRYLFAAIFGEVTGVSPRAADYPSDLAPNHKNWKTGMFKDRFRVQLWNKPSTTVTSHISKDGHYFIHPDPRQCRSLTVREAARLQTFPDNYLFKGTRTQQYIQVGNAVPPFLSKQIAEALFELLEDKINTNYIQNFIGSRQIQIDSMIETPRITSSK